MTLQSILALLLVVACWAVIPALICVRRLRTLGLGHGWGLIVGCVLGPLGVAVINIYISLQYLSRVPGRTDPRLRPGLATGVWPEERRLSVRGDMLALVCLWAVIVLGSTSLTVDEQTPLARLSHPTANNSRPTSMPAQGGAATTVHVAGASAVPSVESLSLQPLNRAARGDAVPKGANELKLLSDGRPIAPQPTAGGEKNVDPTTSPAQPNANAGTQSAGSGPAAIAAAPTIPQPKPAGASAGELMRLLVPSNLKAHGTISGVGRATTLTITCAECTYELGVGRLRGGNARATLKAAGVHIVVLLNGQNSWTFML